MAVSYEDINLLDEAQVQYDELEISLSLALGQRNLLWFGKVIELAPSDDSVPLLSLDKKPYRDMILANTISVFDFRIYLLARQCNLLAKSGKIAEMGRLCITFLTLFSQRLRKVRQSDNSTSTTLTYFSPGKPSSQLFGVVVILFCSQRCRQV